MSYVGLIALQKLLSRSVPPLPLNVVYDCGSIQA